MIKMINTEVLKPLLPNLEDLALMKSAAAVAYGEAIKAAAEKCGGKPAELRKIVAAIVADKKQEEIDAAEEMSRVLESLL